MSWMSADQFREFVEEIGVEGFSDPELQPLILGLIEKWRHISNYLHSRGMSNEQANLAITKLVELSAKQSIIYLQQDPHFTGRWWKR